MSADPTETRPNVPFDEGGAIALDGAASSDVEPAIELDTSRPSDAVLRAAPIAVERGLDLGAVGSSSPDAAPSLELGVAAADLQKRVRETTHTADAPAPSALPRWLIVALGLALVALAGALGSVWLR
jgi:hypothetical protein